MGGLVCCVRRGAGERDSCEKGDCEKGEGEKGVPFHLGLVRTSVAFPLWPWIMSMRFDVDWERRNNDSSRPPGW